MTFLWEMYRSNEQHGVCCFPYEREKVPFRTLFPQMITSINFKHRNVRSEEYNHQLIIRAVDITTDERRTCGEEVRHAN